MAPGGVGSIGSHGLASARASSGRRSSAGWKATAPSGVEATASRMVTFRATGRSILMLTLGAARSYRLRHGLRHPQESARLPRVPLTIKVRSQLPESGAHRPARHADEPEAFGGPSPRHHG